MTDSRIFCRDSIKIGDTVKIAITLTNPPSKYVEGIVKSVLSEKQLDENGIEVELISGYIGHVKEVVDISTSIQLEQRILEREDERVEKKETFGFDVINNIKNNEMKKIIVSAVASLMNSYGGYVYIGVHDNGIVRGLAADYSIMHNGGNNDKLEQQIRDALEKYSENYITISNFIKISFPVVFGHEICEIQVKPSIEPIFLKKQSYDVYIDGKTKPRHFDDFYIRDGNGKKLLETHNEFLTHWKIRFQNI
ncbi:MAG: putative DNA binding domain-containing protein [Nitrosopumilus sp.]|uniref:RNA-binding domain-containing protein n=1 Tax=Nitrosopumilus sp. TaxID=2024843 RepID=UPI00242E31D7|nr:RNA-binding domain-containing protein [Nitrosopumilus sp.]MCV0366390.1 putative DNA binding domain-containing protein [Nitrosopumilus sp.]